ncbi:MAG TPA: tRNA (adenosine(37)-N6)-dimethylallyltransferase MiaA [Verrucomicrobiae bacterium]|jgi:tRNA dimethylallyltransferase
MAKTSYIHPPSSILHPQCIFLAGPTAVGKSEIALLLAEKISGEIISVDSMQVYRGLDIGTAKPSPAERARVRHHLIDVVDLTESFDAAQFVRLATAAVTKIQSRGHVPIFCGGTGLYFKAFLEGIGEAPPADEKMRAELEATPLAELLAELAERDPVTYEKIDRKNARRVIRAVEVIRLTGRKFSEQRAEWKSEGAPASRRQVNADAKQAGETPALRTVAHLIGFSRNPVDLRARIDVRVDAMFARGLVEETRRLLEHGLAQNKTAMQALGYRQVVEHLRGERSLSETIELVKIKTRQFAKRQMTWFRRQLNLQWIELGTTDAPEAVVERLSDVIFSRGFERTVRSDRSLR